MGFEEGAWGGLSALVANERVPFSQAIKADDCYLDDDTIKGRNGYRRLTGQGYVAGETVTIPSHCYIKPNTVANTASSVDSHHPSFYCYRGTWTRVFLRITYEVVSVGAGGLTMEFNDGTNPAVFGTSRTAVGTYTEDIEFSAAMVSNVNTQATGTYENGFLGTTYFVRPYSANASSTKITNCDAYFVGTLHGSPADVVETWITGYIATADASTHTLEIPVPPGTWTMAYLGWNITVTGTVGMDVSIEGTSWLSATQCNLAGEWHFNLPLGSGGANFLNMVNNNDGGTLTIGLVNDDSGGSESVTYDGLWLTLVGTATASIPPQHFGRFRPSPTSAREVIVTGGSAYTLTDPSDDDTTDATLYYADNPFSSTANVSGAQHSKYYYLASDTEGASWWRIDDDYILTEITNLPKPTIPTAAQSSQTLIKFSTLAAPTTAGSLNTTLSYTDYYRCHGAGVGDRCPEGGSLYWNLGANKDFSGIDWLAVVCAAPTASKGGYGGTVNILIAKDVSGSPGDFIQIGTINDRFDGNPGSPNLVYCSLNDLPSDIRAAARYIKFQLAGSDDQFAPHGYLPIPSAPGYGPQKYRITFKNSTSGQVSDPSDEVEVVYQYADVVIPNYHNVFGNGTSFLDTLAYRPIDPDKTNEGRDFNVGAGLAKPDRADMSQVSSFSGAIPTNLQYPRTNTIQLWRLTETGWRLVKDTAFSSGTTYSSIIDDQGSKVLTNDLWRPNGTFNRVNALGAWAGRLIGGYENRVYISDFIPIGEDTDPLPRFAKIAVEDANGWAFDIGASNSEQIQSIIVGDVPYILTDKYTRYMPSLLPDTPPITITAKGVVGRQAAIYIDERLIWASQDGVYSCSDRVNPVELSAGVERVYREWLLPTSDCVLAYQKRKLYIFEGTKFLRFDFRTGRWTRGTLSHTVSLASCFVDPPGGMEGEQMWLLHDDATPSRWQSACDEDLKINDTDASGTTIPDWEYETGYQVEAYPQTIDHVYVDTSGGLRVRVYKDEEGDDYRETYIPPGELVDGFAADFANYKLKLNLSGSNTCQLRRAMLERGGLHLEDAKT